jgi:hypothetical protein
MQSEQVRQGSRPARLARLCLLAAIGVTIGLTVVGSRPSAVAQEKRRLKLDPSLISLHSKEGDDETGLLSTCKVRRSYDSLKDVFIEQKTPTYCGVASACMVLNAVGATTPDTNEQTKLFTREVRRIISPEQVGKSGMTLQQLGSVLGCYPVKVKVVHASETDLPTFRKSAIEALKTPDSYIIANYLRKAIKQETGGHHSPVAAYHEGEDRFLIMDVAQWKYPPVWVKAEQLWKAMTAVDSVSGKSRGYVIIRAQR